MFTSLFALPCLAASYVADTADLLSDATLEALERANSSLADKNGTSIHIYTDTECDGDIADLAYGLFSSYELDERAVLLVVLKDDYYLVRGAGLKDSLSEDEMIRLLKNNLEPEFAAGDPDAGVSKTVSALASLLSRVEKVDLTSLGNSLFILFTAALSIAFLLILILIFTRIVGSKRTRRRRRRKPNRRG